MLYVPMHQLQVFSLIPHHSPVKWRHLLLAPLCRWGNRLLEVKSLAQGSADCLCHFSPSASGPPSDSPATILLYTVMQDAFLTNLLLKAYLWLIWDDLSVSSSFSVGILDLKFSELPFPSLSHYILSLGSPSLPAYRVNAVEAHYEAQRSPRDFIMVLACTQSGTICLTHHFGKRA